MKLIVTDDEGRSHVYEVDQPRVTVGRDPSSHIHLGERNVSRQHAVMERVGGAYSIRDLGSYMGTKVNGERVGEATSLRVGDRLQVGDFVMRVVEAQDQPLGGSHPSALDDSEETSAREPTSVFKERRERQVPARLVMLTPPWPGAEFALTRASVRFGRGEDLDCWINHRSISREHAEIIRENGQFRVVDLGSANGVRVNGTEITSAVINSEDVVEFGQVRFRFVDKGELYSFEADNTVQTEPVESHSRTPVVAGVAVVAAALAVAVALVVGSRREHPGVPAAPGALLQERRLGAGDADALNGALKQCWSALGAGRHVDAVSHATSALSIVPDSAEAKSCRAAAHAAQIEKELFDQGVAALEDGDAEAAYAIFAELPSGSRYWQRREVQKAHNFAAQEYLRRGRSALVSRPMEALAHAHAVMAMVRVSEAERGEAEDIARLARRRMSKVALGSRPSTFESRLNRKGPSADDTPVSEQGRAEGAAGVRAMRPVVDGDGRQGCRTSSDPEACLMRKVGKKGFSPDDRAMLIDLYRRQGNLAAAIRHMRRFVQLYPEDQRAVDYQRTLSEAGYPE